MDETTPESGEAEIGPEMGSPGLPARDLQSTANGVREVTSLDGLTGLRAGDIVVKDGVQYRVPSHGRGLMRLDPVPASAMTGPGPSPTARLRDMMRNGLLDLIPQLFDDVKSGNINKLQFADFLAKYGIGTTGSITHISPDVVSRLERQAVLVASRPRWESHELLALMRDIWA